MITLNANDYRMLDVFLRHLYRETAIPVDVVSGPMLVRCAEMLHARYKTAWDELYESKTMELEIEAEE